MLLLSRALRVEKSPLDFRLKVHGLFSRSSERAENLERSRCEKLLFAMCEIKTDCRIFHVKSEGRVNREMVKKVKKSYINKVYLFFLHYFCTPKHINDNSYAK